MRFALAVTLIAASTLAHAQPSQELTKEFQAGTDAFRLGKLDEAKAHLEAAAKLDPKLPGPQRFLAAVAQAQGRWQDCLDAARKALELNPQSSEAPDTKKLHDQCRVSAGRAPYRGELGDSAAIAVTSNVPGATVRIGGLTYGATPLAPRPITAGPLEIDVDKQGWKPGRIAVTAPAGIVTDVVVDLEPDPNAKSQTDLGVTTTKPTLGWITLADTSVQLALDGKDVPAAARIEVEPGTHVIEIRKPGMDPWRRRIRISAGQKTPIAPQFVETSARSSKEKLGLGILAGSGALLAAGFATALVSGNASAEARDIQRVERARDPSRPVSETAGIAPVRTRKDFEAASDRAKTFATISNISYGAALVTAGVAAYFLYKGSAERADAAPPFAIVPMPDGAFVAKEIAW